MATYTNLALSETIVIGGSGADLGTFTLLSNKFKQSNPDIKFKILPSIGSGGGIKAAKNKKIDLCLTSRKPKQKELSADMVFKLYAQTPLVFAVNNEFNINNLSNQTILDIYTGKMTHWNVKHRDNKLQVKPILRPSNDSDTLLLIKHIPGFDSAIATAYKRRGLPIAATDQDSIELIQSLEGTIGSSTMSIIKTTDSPVKAVNLNGIEASSENLKNGSYPLYKNLYYCHTNSPSPSLLSFINFIASKEAVNILHNTGHHIP